ncbi:Golgi reassembly-stacking protein 1 [Sparganum proliferum]
MDPGSGGYHVLKVQEGSPGHKAGLEAFFDFIISINDSRLQQDSESIKDLLLKYKDTPVRLVVYSSKTQTCREVALTPSADWGGQGLLGLSIRYCSFKGASENVWHILNIEPNSPAALAGLKPYTDYVIGTDALLSDTEDFFSVVEAHNGQPLRLYVYNTESDSCRDVTIIPNLSWGGEGMLGCEIGFGLLHRIPSPPEEANGVAAESPQQTLAASAKDSVSVSNVPPAEPPPPFHEHHHHDCSHTESFTPSSIPPPAPLPANLFELIQPPSPSQPLGPLPPASPTQKAPGTATEPAASDFQQQQQQLLPGLAQPPPPPPPSQPYSVGAIPQQQYAATMPPPPQQQYPAMMPQQQFYTPQQQPQQPSTMFYPSTAPPPNYGTVNSVPLIPTTNVALPGMPPISVPMPPTDLLTGQSYGGFPVHSGVEQ